MLISLVKETLLIYITGLVAVMIGADGAAVRERLAQLNPVVDLRPEFARRGLVPRQQGQRGACQVFAFVGGLEFALAKTGPIDLSEQYLMWAANDACDIHLTEGFNPDRLLKGLGKHGICREQLMAYIPHNVPIASPNAVALRDGQQRCRFRHDSIKHWSEPIGFSTAQLTAICQRLDQGQPVTVTLCWPFGIPDSQIVDRHGFLIDRGIDGTSKNGHGVVLVGYAGQPQSDTGYFLLRNSWGPGFALGGYAKVDFALARRYGTDAYTVTLTPTDTVRTAR